MSQELRWNTRYQEAGDEYLFVTEPNRFLAHRADLLRNGRTALGVAAGSGRNSVWLVATHFTTARPTIAWLMARLSIFQRWTWRLEPTRSPMRQTATLV